MSALLTHWRTISQGHSGSRTKRPKESLLTWNKEWNISTVRT